MSPLVSAEIKNVHKGNSVKAEEDSFTFKSFVYLEHVFILSCWLCQVSRLLPQGTGNPCSKCCQGVAALIFVESSGISCGKAGAVKPRRS